MSDLKKVSAFTFTGEESFEDWAFQMRAFLRHHDLHKVIDLRDDHAPDARPNARVFDILVMNCKDKPLQLLREVREGDGRAAWRILLETFAGRRPIREATLQCELFTREWRDDDTVDTFRSDIMRIRRSLMDMGELSIIPDRAIGNLVVTRIPKDRFATVISARLSSELTDDKASKLDHLFDAMALAERTYGKAASDVNKAFFVRKQSSAASPASNSSSSGARAQAGDSCHFCGRSGHYEKDCRDKKSASTRAHERATSKKGAASSAPSSQSKVTHAFSVVDVHLNIDHVLSASADADFAGQFVLDSGSTRHICTNASLFTEFKSFSGTKPIVKVANGHVLEAQGVGLVRLDTLDDHGNLCTMALRDTLYIPSFACNLVSQTRITKDSTTGAPTGNVYTDGPQGARLLFANGDIVPLQTKQHLNWFVPAVTDVPPLPRHQPSAHADMDMAHAARQITRVSVQDFHDLMGHLNFRDLKAIASDSYGVTITDKDQRFCDPCVLGKSARKPVPKESNKRDTKPAQLIHSDLSGPMETTSLSGGRYAVVFIDDATNWTGLYVLRNKSDLQGALQQFIEDMRTCGADHPFIIGDGTVLQSDNGGEYRSAAFASFCAAHGIRQQWSPPHTQACNGVAERMWNTLVDTARSMLQASDLPTTYWAAALKHAAFLRNRSPTSALEGKTPFEALMGIKPNLSVLHKFGARAFVHVERDQRTKWQAKAREGIYIGHQVRSMTHLVYMPKTKSVVETMHVDFDEGAIKPVAIEIKDPFDDENENENGGGCAPTTGVPEGTLPSPPSPPSPQPASDGAGDEGEHQATATRAPHPPHHAGHPTTPTTPTLAVDMGNEGEHGEVSVPKSPPTDVLVDDFDDNLDPEVILQRVDTRAARDDLDDDPLLADMAFVAHVMNNATVADPTTAKEAFSIPGGIGEEWRQAFDEEMKAHMENNTWTIVDRQSIPRTAKIVTSKAVFKTKLNADGSINKRKVRIVAKGFTQRKGIDYDEITSPVVHLETVRTIAALVGVSSASHIHQIDFKTAFLNPVIQEEIYMELPSGVDVDEFGKRPVSRLNKCIYGLKQASRSWYELLHAWMIKDGFTRSLTDPCLYFKNVGQTNAMLLTVWVDDTIIACNIEPDINSLKDRLRASFKLTDLGPIGFCLGLEISRTDTTIQIRQHKFIGEILQRFGMSDCKPVSTPMVPHTTLGKTATDQSTSGNDGDGFDPSRYRELVGCLMYLVAGTRPDIAAAVGQLARYMSDPAKHHWTAAKHVLRYLRGTMELGLIYSMPSVMSSAHILQGFADADWASDTTTRRSTTGYAFMLNGAAVSWASKTQQTVALSTAEAEYMAVCAATQEAIHLRQLLQELGYPQDTTKIYEDNQPCIFIANNPATSTRTKHIDIRALFVRERIKRGEIILAYLPTEEMIADSLTKNLDRVKIVKFRGKLLGGT